MYTALCAHAINDCAFTNISLDQCVNAGMPACCADQCAAKAITPNATVNQCVLALEVEDCNYVAQNLTPPECAGIPAIP